MEKDILFELTDKIIALIRDNLARFKDNYIELSRQLYRIENMRLSSIPEKYILQTLKEDNALILKVINGLSEEELLMELSQRLSELDND